MFKENFQKLWLILIVFQFILISCQPSNTNADSNNSEKEITNTPIGVTTFFIEALGKRNFTNAYECCKNESWGSLEKFSSSESFGGINNTAINEIIQEPDEKGNAVVYVNASYFDSINGDKRFKQKFHLQQYGGQWKITKLSIIENENISNNSDSKKVDFDWEGTWIYTNDTELISYELKIEGMTMNRHECEFTGVGMQTDFNVSCRGYNFGDRIDIHFMDVVSGGFSDEWDVNKPLFTLYLKNNTVYTKWVQLQYSNTPGVFFKKSK